MKGNSILKDQFYPERIRKSRIGDRTTHDEFASDRSRILFCTSFRRMMKKAQVFSLEENTSVRNRLTHSIEVSDIGKSLAREVGKRLEKRGLAERMDSILLEQIVENGCLAHDIGNPPFGHFGEEAIKTWFQNNDLSSKFCQDDKTTHSKFPRLLADLKDFDGNPQGFRILTRLHTEIDEFGLNLSYSALLASIKYPACPDTKKSSGWRKSGIFNSEWPLYRDICDEKGIAEGKRYFAAYLVELADDICYCLSDITDAFEKKFIDYRLFWEELRKIFTENNYDWQIFTDKIKLKDGDEIECFSHQIAVRVSREIFEAGAEYFCNNIEEYIAGDAKDICESIEDGVILKALKQFARKFIYVAPEVQKIEIAGFQVVKGLLDHYSQLLALSVDEFHEFAKEGKPIKGKSLDLHWRIFNQLSERMLESYLKQLKDGVDNENSLRVRLIVDYVAGLTDVDALRFYQNAQGISIDR